MDAMHQPWNKPSSTQSQCVNHMFLRSQSFYHHLPHPHTCTIKSKSSDEGFKFHRADRLELCDGNGTLGTQSKQITPPKLSFFGITNNPFRCHSSLAAPRLQPSCLQSEQKRGVAIAPAHSALGDREGGDGEKKYCTNSAIPVLSSYNQTEACFPTFILIIVFLNKI